MKGSAWRMLGAHRGRRACWYVPGAWLHRCELLPDCLSGNYSSVMWLLQNKNIRMHIVIKQIGEVFGFFKEFRIPTFENSCNTAKQIFTILEIETEPKTIILHGKKLLFLYEASDNPIISEVGPFKVNFFFL